MYNQGLKEYVWVLYTTVLIFHGSLAIDNNCIMLYLLNDLIISQFQGNLLEMELHTIRTFKLALQ